MKDNDVIENGVRVYYKCFKEYGTIIGHGTFNSKLSYTIRLDDWKDCVMGYREEFDVVDNDISSEEAIVCQT